MQKTRMPRLLAAVLALLFVAALAGCGDKAENAAEDAYPGLLITPVVAVEYPVEEMADEEVLALFETQLYSNGLVMWDFINGKNLELDSETALGDSPEGTHYVLVTNIADMDTLRQNYQAAYSDRFCQAMLYPFFLEGALPLFVEQDGALYYNEQMGGGFSQSPEFDRAVLTEKTAGGFTIEMPMGATANGETWALFGMEIEDGFWIIETIRMLD